MLDRSLIGHLVIQYGREMRKFGRARALAERKRIGGKPTDRTRKLLRNRGDAAIEESERLFRQIDRLLRNANG
jgi:hypothetical protein